MSGYKAGRRRGSRQTVMAHRLVAEKAIGHRLPDESEIHHVDANKHNNEPTNLVVCPNHSYHMLLHVRTRALEGCGNPDWRQCGICKRWDSLNNLKTLLRNHYRGGTYTQTWHRVCDTEKARLRRVKKYQDIALQEVE